MANQKRVQANQPGKDSPVNLILTGVACLAIGLGIGYYFGRQVSEVNPPASFAPSASQGSMPIQGQQAPVQDPAAFIQQEASLKAIVAATPKDLNALIQLGNLYYDHNQYQQAIEWYGKALEIDPKNPNVRTDRGTSYWNLNQPDPAIAEFQKALEVDPGHAQTLYNMGVVYLHGKNDLEGAKKAWQMLLSRNPSYPDRAKVEQQLAALAAPPVEAMPGQKKTGTSGMEDLLERMKSRP